MRRDPADRESCGCRYAGQVFLREIEDASVDDGVDFETDEIVESSRALRRHIVDHGASPRQC